MRYITAFLLCLGLLLSGCAQTPADTEPTLPPSRFSPEDFSYQDGYLTCNAAEAVMGIDVSHHQQQIDWPEVARAGVEFAIVRLGYRGLSQGELHTDAYAIKNLTEARAAGLQIGAYFYSQAVSPEEARQEAALAIEILDGMTLELPLVFDWEIEDRTAQVDVPTATACAVAFCEAVKAAGYTPMVYFNSYQAKERLDMQALTDYGWWLAMYDVAAPFPCRADLWQYTCTGNVPGIAGAVDINLMFMAQSV